MISHDFFMDMLWILYGNMVPFRWGSWRLARLAKKSQQKVHKLWSWPVDNMDNMGVSKNGITPLKMVPVHNGKSDSHGWFRGYPPILGILHMVNIVIIYIV